MFLPLKNEIPNLPMCYRFELTPNTGVPNDDGIYFHDDDELYHMTNYGANSNIYSKDVYKKYGIKKDSIMNNEEQLPSLRVEGLRKKFGGREVVCGVDLEAKGGEVVGLLGPNGAGKTTTFSMVAGFLTPSSGKVLLNNDDLTRLPAYKRARKGIVYLPQESSVFRKLTVEENVRAIAETLSISKEEQDHLVEVRLEELNLSHLSRQKAYTLSGVNVDAWRLPVPLLYRHSFYYWMNLLVGLTRSV